MSTDSHQGSKEPKQFRLGPLGNLTQVTRGLARTIRAMAAGVIDSQVGARICNGLGIMRQCLETQELERLGTRLDELERERPDRYAAKGIGAEHRAPH